MDKMNISPTFVTTILAASLRVTFASPTLFSRQNDLCGKQCWIDDDCSGTCQWCSQPAQWKWQCVDFDPHPPTTSAS
ncbi:uncharacterized protein F4822DRAFT_383732 [Hypoxylon trugodes]|uniref:uncharacterized protein n=1 Tax=Hypoxylon trugodes TaxID=326681 RepID=UPI0021A144E0|nr:uncharacterized protein F4822DRAFT_383732 [Hypoxylon trugodes]KAI1393166.1 hypothetical protein F4822DRAFT_383732 [Hypoxylon trugodes]